MEDWKQAITLAKFELRNSKRALISLGALLISFGLLMIYAAPQLVESSFYDLFFLLFIGMAASWAKPKEFQIDKMKDGSTGLLYFVMLHQLPIRKEVLIKNRFVIYYVYSIPAHLLFLFSMYAFSEEIRTILTFSEYATFTIIWLSFGIYWGALFPLTDIGEVTKMSPFKRWLYMLLFMAIIIGGVSLLKFYTGYGIVYSSMLLVQKWPLLSSILSIIAAVVCTKLALRKANKNIMKIDY